MNWLHAFYSVGAMLGPLIMTAMITSAGAWRGGYLIVASFLLTLSILFMVTRAQWGVAAAATAEPAPAGPRSLGRTLRNGIVWIQTVLFFVYTGVEVAIGQWSFTVLTEGRGISREVAGLWVTLYWGSILFGRVALGFVVERFNLDHVIRACILAAVAGTGLFAWNPFPQSAPIALCLCGAGLSVVFPCLMTRTPQRLGSELAAHAIGFQVGAANLGAATLPSITGWVAQSRGIDHASFAILLMAVCLMALHEVVLFSGRFVAPARSV